jgi:hypothetical protein
MLTYFQIEGTGNDNTPMISSQAWDKNAPPDTNFPYRRFIGCVLWLCQNTRVDCSYALKELGSQSSRKDTVKAANRVLRYLRRNPRLGLTYTKVGSSNITGFEQIIPELPGKLRSLWSKVTKLFGVTDADWASGRQDGRKSTSARMVFLGNKLVEWSSKTQKCIALSTTEAEYVAMSEMAKTLVYF